MRESAVAYGTLCSICDISNRLALLRTGQPHPTLASPARGAEPRDPGARIACALQARCDSSACPGPCRFVSLRRPVRSVLSGGRGAARLRPQALDRRR